MKKFKNIVCLSMILVVTFIFLCSITLNINKIINVGAETNTQTATANSDNSEILPDETKPNISINEVELLSPRPNPTAAREGSTIDVKYKIKVTPENTITRNIKKKPVDEVLFLFDLSKNSMAQADYFQHILINDVLQNNSNSANMKFGIIGMGSSPNLIRGDGEKDKYQDINKDLSDVDLLENTGGNINDVIQRRIKNATSMQQSSNITEANVMDSLVKADSIFSNATESGSDKSKAIVLMVNNNFVYNEEIIKNLKNKGYKIIVFDASYNKDKKQSPAHENLQKVFNYLNGYNENVNSISAENTEQGNNPHFNQPDIDGGRINKALLDGNYNMNYRLSDLKFNFDLGEGFKPVIKEDKSTGYNLVREESLGEHRYSISIPNIEFKGEVIKEDTINNTAQISYTPMIGENKITNGYIEAQFKVKFVKQTGENPVVFGTKDTVKQNNFFSYNDIDGNLISHVDIDTPEVNAQFDIEHGIYIDSNTIDDSNAKEFSKDSLITMAAKFNTSGPINSELQIDSRLELDGNPKVYKINSNGTLQLVQDMTNNKYTSVGGDTRDTIVIYTVKLKDSSSTSSVTLTNSIIVNNNKKDANLKIKSDELPDLF